ncbi:MAG: sterol desaturase family protein [Alphaproteobacteria bacterium]|nr:sterol desaturase family protein [Alphaproteobacteria bacterium]
MEPFPSPTTLAIPAFLVSLIWEWWAVKTGRAKGRYDTRDALTSIAMGLGNVATGAATAGLSAAMMMMVWPLRVFEMPVSIWSGVLLFVLYDFAYYWKHRLAHRIRWFWTEHVTHHSSERYNLTTALRQPWFGPLTGLIWIGSPLVVLGFHPAFIAFIAGLNLLYQFWIHTEAVDRMPVWFEAVMNTPSHHRVHHATNPRYLDSNYAGVFIIWDKMFGTFVAEVQADPPIFGIVTPVRSYNPLKIAYHELVSLISDCARDGLRPVTWAKRFVQPPGWSPDGRHMRSEDIRRTWRKAAAARREPD